MTLVVLKSLKFLEYFSIVENLSFRTVFFALPAYDQANFVPG